MKNIVEKIEAKKHRKLGHVQLSIVKAIEAGRVCQFRDYYGKCQSKGYSQACIRWAELIQTMQNIGIHITITPGKLGGTWTQTIKKTKKLRLLISERQHV